MEARGSLLAYNAIRPFLKKIGVKVMKYHCTAIKMVEIPQITPTVVLRTCLP